MLSAAATINNAAHIAPSSAWRQARKILCIRLDYLGDVLMCTPAIRAIKQSRPDRSVTLLSSSSGVAAAPFIPHIDAAIAYAAPWMKSAAAHDDNIEKELVPALREAAFDAAVIFTSYSQSALPAALLCLLAGIPLRLAHCRENPYHLLTDWAREPEPQERVRHEVQRQLDLVAHVGCIGYGAGNERLSFAVREQDVASVRQRLTEKGIDLDQPWLLLHPGATAPSRRYPAAHWSQVIHQLVAQRGFSVVLTGSAGEVDLIDSIRQASAVATCSLAGELDLGQLGAAIALATIVISNNTGPAHMAAAIGIPLVDLYALTNPQHTPWQVESRLLFHDVPCRFCYKSICPQGHHDCLAQVRPDQVVDAVQSLIGRYE